ncbi:gamma-butyrobetaine hydroxylase-like domain-containing protein [Sulfuriflexus mobilis]|uniref:gamma-butyrobetaine hydroxylase-like domain-containing protein n=1 Tax=Sulfuriflexus mobilis TaxID=1811807 RepID=UPI000F81E134|nr:gamma-butyrobetaine hydroxylase-like domain-containing protein [Sulfuriflexus mobilis]
MNRGEEDHRPLPVELTLHQACRILEVSFVDGKVFSLPCEYLHVCSPVADARDAGQLCSARKMSRLRPLSRSVATPCCGMAMRSPWWPRMPTQTDWIDECKQVSWMKSNTAFFLRN